MKKVALASFIFLLTLLHATHDASKIEETDQEGTVLLKVLIKENVEGALVDVRGKYKVYNPQNGKQLSSGYKGKRYYLQANDSGLKWGEGYPGVHQIKIVPASNDTTILIDGIQYKGSLEVYDINRQLQLVNELNVEDFLKSTLSQQFSDTDYTPSTYEAIAISMRTTLYDAILKNHNPYWDVLAKNFSYLGYGATLIHQKVDHAVTATKNLILTYNDKPFSTSWTSNSGGRTASYEAIFRKKSDGPSGVAVAFAQKERELHKWKCSFSSEALAKMFGLTKITACNLYQDKATNKTYALKLCDESRFVELTFFEFQEKVGKNRMLSNDLSVQLKENSVFFEGYGKGAGVGLCLFSADQMARSGSSAPQILNHFYPSTHLVKLSILPEYLKEDGNNGSP